MQLAFRVWNVFGGDTGGIDIGNFQIPKTLVHPEETTEEQALAEAAFVENAFMAVAKAKPKKKTTS